MDCKNVYDVTPASSEESVTPLNFLEVSTLLRVAWI
jgi:hypothetical protein